MCDLTRDLTVQTSAARPVDEHVASTGMVGIMDRIYFDGNEGTETGQYGLWLSRSIEDLGKIPGGPKEGMKVTLYMTGEIEMEAILEWSARWNGWTGRPVEGTTRDNREAWD